MGRNMGSARDYEKFDQLKKERVKKVTEKNAVQVLENSRMKMFELLEKLDINNITEVENLYLVVAQLSQAATFVAAKEKAASRNISFDKALESIGTDDLLSTLDKSLKNQPGVENFFKFIEIDNKYKPAKQAWAGAHARMEAVAKLFATKEKVPEEKIGFIQEKLEQIKLFVKNNKNEPELHQASRKIEIAFKQYTYTGNQDAFSKKMDLISNKLTQPLWRKTIEDFVNAVRGILKSDEEKKDSKPFKFYKDQLKEHLQENVVKINELSQGPKQK